MRLSYIAYMSILNLRKRKLRSFLTIGGMSIGISAIVFLVSLGFGLQKLIVSQITNIEALTILDVSTGASALLKIDDTVTETFKAIPNVVDVSPSFSISGKANYNGAVTDIALYGINPAYIELEGLRPTFGNMFDDPDAKETALSTTAAELLGLGSVQDIIGQTITYQLSIDIPAEVPEGTRVNPKDPPKKTTKVVEEKLKVVGILNDDITLAYMPLSILQSMQPKKDYNLARVKVVDSEHLNAVRKTIEARGFQVDSIADTVGQIDQIFLIFQIIMAGFGLVAMFVASLGAFNTLTVSLLERTREVGILKALGTTSRDIFGLFLTEAFLIGALGGASGLIFGYGFGELVNFAINILARRFGGQPVDVFYTPLYMVGLVMGIILMVSFGTGFYPARRASKLNPLDALRYE